ncbi:MAG TPA: NAD+ synthase [Thermodesulfobacteriota bacterium]|nr:NAD+ synthase [Thermodesulfobacteriota bacterium]
MRTLRVAMAQINPVVGDLSANARKILAYAEKAKARKADLVIFPELAVTGYPPEDLLLKPRFISDNLKSLDSVARKIRGITAVVGFVDRKVEIYNAAAVVQNGRVAGVYHKMYLPNYGVFDEQRYFQAGGSPLNFVLNGVTVGLNICEDIWYPEGPTRAQALAGAELIVNINASPYNTGKALVREEMLVTRALDNDCIIAYNNTVGGQDELVFDGRGLIIDASGGVLARGKAFEEDLIIEDLNMDSTATARLRDTRRREVLYKSESGGVREIVLKAAPRKTRPRLPKRAVTPLDPSDEVLKALVLGTRDYVVKNGFRHAVIGLSGGIDSSLVAAVAAKALGAKNLTGVFMPSMYSSAESRDDAVMLAKNLGIELLTVPISSTFESYLKMLKKPFAGTKKDTTEENLQARIRGNILMALSNKYGWLVLTTGNKSEMSVGYATLYGDMAGGFAVIKDLPKTLVYSVSRKVNENAGFPVIPERVLVKAPTAELRPHQTDQDTLPPYEVLDPVLKAYVEEDKSLEEITALGFKRALVKKVIRMVDKSEYKRRQAPPGIKITPRALGKDRRMPITNGYDDENSK